jgi:hypothetical protein
LNQLNHEKKKSTSRLNDYLRTLMMKRWMPKKRRTNYWRRSTLKLFL